MVHEPVNKSQFQLTKTLEMKPKIVQNSTEKYLNLITKSNNYKKENIHNKIFKKLEAQLTKYINIYLSWISKFEGEVCPT